MCELVAMFCKSVVSRRDAEDWLFSMAAAYRRNSDGVGAIFFDIDNHATVIKRLRWNEFIRDKAVKVWLRKSKAIIGHTRLATSGVLDIVNTQPIEGRRFMIAHNGVVGGGTRKYSDTYLLLRKFEKKGKTTKDPVEVIERVLRDTVGSMSIFLYDKATKRLFYWKNDGTSMHMTKTKDTIWMHTNEKAMVKESIDEGKSEEVESGKLYEIDLDKARIKEIKEIEALKSYGVECSKCGITHPTYKRWYRW